MFIGIYDNISIIKMLHIQFNQNLSKNSKIYKQNFIYLRK